MPIHCIIDRPEKSEYPAIVDVWEASVRATHLFLPESDIEYFKPLILNSYLDAVDLRVVRTDDRKIIGFIGVADRSLEMLFLHPEFFGTGLGRQLMDFAVKEWNINRVDVNEQNEQATRFYKNFGFKVKGRSELDPQGKPYPILHLEL